MQKVSRGQWPHKAVNTEDSRPSVWSHVTFRSGGHMQISVEGLEKDITHVPFDMEVKARSAFQPKAWIDQVTKRASKSKDLPIVVCRLNGQGESSPQDYLAFMRLGDLVDLLLKSGYGDFTGDLATLEPQRCKMCGAWAFTPLCRTCEVDPDANL
jgi:hypothetical protein